VFARRIQRWWRFASSRAARFPAEREREREREREKERERKRERERGRESE